MADHEGSPIPYPGTPEYIEYLRGQVDAGFAKIRYEAATEMLNRVVSTLEARAEGRNQGGDIRVMQAVDRIVQAALAEATRLRPISEYHEDCGAVLWHHLPISEPPYVGTPNDSNFGHKYYTHWQKLLHTPTNGSELVESTGAGRTS